MREPPDDETSLGVIAAAAVELANGSADEVDGRDGLGTEREDGTGGEEGSGASATALQYARTSSRDFQLGKRMPRLKSRHVEVGIFCRLPFGVVGRVEVVDGLKLGREGWRREFRWAEMESSTAVRERRRKSRRAVVLKQNWGVKVVWVDDVEVTAGGADRNGVSSSGGKGEGIAAGGVGEGRDQKKCASLINVMCVHR